MTSPKRWATLQTQKDGRIYAVRALDQLKKAGGSDDYCICPFDPDGELGDAMNPLEYYRKGPQWDGFANAVAHLFKAGTLEAQKGFLAILTDCFAGNVSVDLSFYRRLERKGYLQDFGERGDAMPLPVGLGTWEEVERLTGWKPENASGTSA